MAVNMGDAIGYIKLNIQDFKKKFDEVSADALELDKTADGLGKVFDNAGKIMAAAFAAVSAAAAAALKSVIDVGSTFQSSMSQVAATMGMAAEEVASNGEEYKKLSDAAKEMGATTKFSASQAADALNYLALAGYSVEESISTLPTVLNLAAAGGMDLARASDMVTDAMSALGLPLEEAALFTDRMARAAQKSNTSVEQLGDAILQIGGTAKSLAGGVTELDTALGILANNGIKAAEGGTALRQVILNLTAPTEKAAAYMEEIGLSAYDAAGNMKPLNQIFRELDEIMSQFTTQQEKDSVLTQIFDARQLKSARALLSNYGDAWDELYEEIENADGAASRMAETMQENLTGAVTIAKSALEGVQVTVFEALENGLTKSVKTATGSIDQLNKTLQTPEMQEALQKIGTMLGDLLAKFTEFVANKAIPKMIEWFSKLDVVAENLKATFEGLKIALPGLLIALAPVIKNTLSLALSSEKAIAAIKTLKIAITALTSPIGLVSVALGVVVGAYVKYVSEIKRASKAAYEQETAFSKAADAARDNADALDESIRKSEEIKNAKIEEINELRNATNALSEYATGEKLTADELANAQTIIEKLNELYPENTALIEDGQVVGYNELAIAIKNYTDKLYYAQQLEANKEQYFTSKETIEETTAALEGQAEAVVEAQNEYLRYSKALDLYVQTKTISSKQINEEIKASGKSARIYLEEQTAAAKANFENIAIAYNTNKQTLAKAETLYKESSDKMLKLRIQAGEQIEGIYASEEEARIATANQQGQEYQKILQEQHKDEIEAANKLAEDKQKAYENMWTDLAKLDKDWQLRIVDNEDEYQKRRKELLEQGAEIGVDDDNWIKEYNKSLVYQENATKEAEDEKTRIEKEAAEKRQKEREDEIDRQIEALKDRNEIDESYTKEMMMNDWEAIVNGLDKNSSEYAKYYKEFLQEKRQFNKEAAKANKEAAESDFEAWQKSYNDVVNEATEAYDKIKSNQENLMKSLTGNLKLYDTESTKVWDKQARAYKTIEKIDVSAKSMKEQAAATEEYTKSLEDLQGKIPDSLMAEIYAMDREEGAKYVAALQDMSDTELKQYAEAYQKQYDLAKEFSEKVYAEQLQSFKQNYTDKFENIFKEVPKNMNLVGQDSINGFIKGIEEKNADTEGAMKEVMDGVVTKAKEVLDIHSPSKTFEEIGSNTILGFINGLNSKWQEIIEEFKTLGENSGNSFANGFRSVWQAFAESLKNEVTEMSASMISDFSNSFTKPKLSGYSYQPTTQYDPQQYSIESGISGSTGKQLSKEDIVSAIKQAMPDGNVILQADGRQLALITRKELNAIGSESGNLNIKI